MELLRRGATPGKVDHWNTTALWRAARYGHTDLVKELLKVREKNRFKKNE